MDDVNVLVLGINGEMCYDTSMGRIVYDVDSIDHLKKQHEIKEIDQK